MKNAMTATTLSTPFLVCAMILGTLSKALGGFVSAQLSKAAPYLNALAFGAAGIIIGALMAEGLPLWYNIPAFGAVIPASLFGAYFFARRQGFNT